MQCEDFHRVVIRNDPATGLRAVIAIHDVTLGPALGGVRRWVYPDQQAAIADVLALARGMTFKNALAGLPFGGGKSVILAERQGATGSRPITEAALAQFGRCIEELGGEYVAAEDVGMRVADLRHMAKTTPHVTGIGRRGIGGNPGPKTAQGVLAGIRVVAERPGIRRPARRARGGARSRQRRHGALRTAASRWRAAGRGGHRRRENASRGGSASTPWHCRSTRSWRRMRTSWPLARWAAP